MAFFTTSAGGVQKQVIKEFGENDDYLVVLKHNSIGAGLVQLFINTDLPTFDSSRESILYFNRNGIYEKEIGVSDRTPFELYPWREIEDFEVTDKDRTIILNFRYRGHNFRYEADMSGGIMNGNEKRYENLLRNHWYR